MSSIVTADSIQRGHFLHIETKHGSYISLYSSQDKREINRHFYDPTEDIIEK
jgi:hypothetical protein